MWISQKKGIRISLFLTRKFLDDSLSNANIIYHCIIVFE